MLQTKSRYYRNDHDVLLAVIASHRERGRGPTYREIQDAIGVSGHSTVIRCLDRLEAAGYVTRGEAYKRGTIAPTVNGLAAAGLYQPEERIEALGIGA